MMNEEYLLRRPDYETDNFLFYIRLFCILPVSETEILFTNIHISPLICQHMILLNKERIARTLKRISMQIAEETKGSHIHLIGMNKRDRKSTRLNSSHVAISYAVFCLKKKT